MEGYFGDSFYFWVYHSIFNAKFTGYIDNALHIYLFFTSHVSIAFSTLLCLVLFYFFHENLIEIGFGFSVLFFINILVFVSIPNVTLGFWLKFIFLFFSKIFGKIQISLNQVCGINGIIRYHCVEIGGTKYTEITTGMFRSFYYCSEALMIFVFNESFRDDPKNYYVWRITLGIVSFLMCITFGFMTITKIVKKKIL
jgi:hypothetical protein